MTLSEIVGTLPYRFPVIQPPALEELFSALSVFADVDGTVLCCVEGPDQRLASDSRGTRHA